VACITIVALIVLVPLLFVALFIKKRQPRYRRALLVPRPVAALLVIVYVAVYRARHGNVTGSTKVLFFLGCLGVAGVGLAIKLWAARGDHPAPATTPAPPPVRTASVTATDFRLEDVTSAPARQW
jgi:hypothetical protein